VSEEIDLAAKTTGAVAGALVGESGALEPARAYADAITSTIHYRFYPRVIRQAMAAAEKIRRSGLPRRAYTEIPDKLLRAILENGALETDESMQERWANLLANAGTEGPTEIKAAFPSILRDLDAVDAATLDQFAERTSAKRFLVDKFTNVLGKRDSASLDNLTRLGLLRYIRSMPTTLDKISDREATIDGVVFTELGWAFVQACREPQPAD
jgi:hypothetical protein